VVVYFAGFNMKMKGFVHSSRLQDYERTEGTDILDRHRFTFFSGEDCRFMNYVLVGPAEVTFELPDNWNPTAEEIEILQSKRDEVAQKMQDEMTKKLTLMDDEISKLRCLEYEHPKETT
jgi:hypothetical protein